MTKYEMGWDWIVYFVFLVGLQLVILHYFLDRNILELGIGYFLVGISVLSLLVKFYKDKREDDTDSN